MYQQSNNSYDSVQRRLSSKNPFRPAPRAEQPPSRLSTATFDDWVRRNKNLIELSDEEETVELARPAFPALCRTGSDSDVSYSRYVFLRTVEH